MRSRSLPLKGDFSLYTSWSNVCAALPRRGIIGVASHSYGWYKGLVGGLACL